MASYTVLVDQKYVKKLKMRTYVITTTQTLLWSVTESVEVIMGYLEALFRWKISGMNVASLSASLTGIVYCAGEMQTLTL